MQARRLLLSAAAKTKNSSSKNNPGESSDQVKILPRMNIALYYTIRQRLTKNEQKFSGHSQRAN
jgi:hypothetical protein